MYGSFLLIAFILGFWCIWSASRDVNSLGEALGFTVLAMVIKATMEGSGMPDLDAQLLTTWGILYLFTVVVLEAIDRFSESMGMNMGIALVGSAGWFFLAKYLFSEAGIAKVASWVG